MLALATASNIGSVATVTGNPQNMLIGTFSHMSFGEFSAALTPVAAIGLLLDFGLIAVIYRSHMKWHVRMEVKKSRIRIHRPLLLKSFTACLMMFLFFFLGADFSMVALAAAAALLITRRVKPEKVYRAIDWELLTKFAGLFVIIGAVEKAGLAREVFAWARPDKMKQLPYLAAVVAVVSNVVSNVPAVLLFKSFIPHLADPKTGWLILAMSSTLAGNLTLLGSIANLIVAQGARDEVKITFAEYAKVGVPITLLTVVIGILMLL